MWPKPKTYNNSCKLLLICLLTFPVGVKAEIDENQMGAWFSWFYNRNIDSTPWATQMIIQQRYWDFDGDLQQGLIQGLVSYKPANHPIRYGVGYYHMKFGISGPSNASYSEDVLLQQGLYTTLWGEKNYMTFRVRLEQHDPDWKDRFWRLRTYFSLNRPLNQTTLDNGAWYLSLYDEYFTNLDTVEFAFNRIYGGLGYKFTDHTSFQLGIMRQSTRSYDKNQILFSLFHHY